MRYYSILCFCMLFFCGLNAQPRLEEGSLGVRLIVNEKPFLPIAGELGNSSATSIEYLDSLWPSLQPINLNTLLIPLCWDQIEPQEGVFDFSLVDEIINTTRKHNYKIVFLWFGSWKNMVSTYVPAWVKKNHKRFPLVEGPNGERIQMLTSHSDANVDADCKAFAALMKHIGEVDRQEQTVIMMQVENEVGLSSGQRDMCASAQKAFLGNVPSELMQYISKNKKDLVPDFYKTWADNGLKTSGTWTEVFGEGEVCNEIFMSTYLSKYIGKVIAAGKKEYNIPMFVNASIGRSNLKLSTYPSGGPIPLTMNVWRAMAPELDVLSPDIYYGNFEEMCRLYKQCGNPLLIPETRGGEIGAARALYAYGHDDAVCFSPFFIENYTKDPIASAYKALEEFAPLILSSKIGVSRTALMLDNDNPEKTITLGAHNLICKFRGKVDAFASAIIVAVNDDEYYVLGKNIDVQFSLANNKKKVCTGILMAEDGHFVDGQWKSYLRMNGDQIMLDYSFINAFEEGRSGNGLRFNNDFNIQHVVLYHY